MLLPLIPVRSFLRTKKVEYGVNIIRAKRSHVTRLSCVTANTSYLMTRLRFGILGELVGIERYSDTQKQGRHR